MKKTFFNFQLAEKKTLSKNASENSAENKTENAFCLPTEKK